MEPGPVIETQRLTLRPFQGDELDDIHAILGDALTMRFYPAPFSIEQTKGWIERQMERYETDGFGLWVIELKTTGEILGNCGPVVQFVDARREVELGWHVKKTHWGQGIAPEAAAASAAHAMNVLGLERLISIIRPVNRPSARVAEKIGMQVEKQADYKGLLHDIYVLEKGQD